MSDFPNISENNVKEVSFIIEEKRFGSDFMRKEAANRLYILSDQLVYEFPPQGGYKDENSSVNLNKKIEVGEHITVRYVDYWHGRCIIEAYYQGEYVRTQEEYAQHRQNRCSSAIALVVFLEVLFFIPLFLILLFKYMTSEKRFQKAARKRTNEKKRRH